MLTDDTLTMSDNTPVPSESWLRRVSFKKVLSVEWLGQTVASVCWICSVLVYRIQSPGDWLQLCAASAWLLAKLAAVIKPKMD